MTALNTSLTRLLDITTPIVNAPMAMQGTLLNIALATHKAGGFGFIALGYDGLTKLKSNLQSLRTTLQIPPSSPIPIGVGFIAWVMDESKEDVITAVLEERPKALWFAFGADMGKYVQKVRTYDQEHGSKTLVFVMVNSVEEATKAVTEWQVDVLVVQGKSLLPPFHQPHPMLITFVHPTGSEAGGHLSASAPPLSILLTAILTSLPAQTRPPILAAGGIHTGSQLASYLTLGASGAVLGTRFLFTPESSYDAPKMDALLRAGIKDTVITTAFDEVRGTLGWTGDYQGRVIRNDVVKDKEEGLDLEERKRRFRSGEGDRKVLFAGMGVGLTHEVKSAGDVVREIHEDTVHALRAAVHILGE